MKYTFQEISDSGSFGYPYGDDVKHATSIEELKDALENWGYQHEQVGSEEYDAFLMVWHGSYDDVTDMYPDFEIVYGPRGGIRKNRL